MLNKKNRFTLIELIVVIVVLGILSAIVVPNIKDVREKAKVAAVKSNIRNIQTAVDMFHLDYGYYPTDKQPEFIEDKDNPENISGFLVGKEPINFEKSNFVTNYLRSIPTDECSYYVDAWGIVSINEEISNINKDYAVQDFNSGVHTNFVTLKNGDLYSWGYNSNGQLGLENLETKIDKPTKVDFFNERNIRNIRLGLESSFALMTNGEVYSWGSKGLNEFDTSINIPTKVNIPNNASILDLEVNHISVIAKSNNNQFYVWGSNVHGALGLGNTESYKTPQPLDFFKKLIDK